MRIKNFCTLMLVSIFTYATVYYFMSTVEQSRPRQTLTPETQDKLTKLESEILSEKKSTQLLIQKLESFIQTHWEEKTLHENLQNAVDENSKEADEIQKRKLQQILAHPVAAIAVLVFACNRVTVTRCLDQLIKYRPDSRLFPIIVSQDCQHEPTARAIQSYGDQVYHIQQPDQSDIQVPPKEKKFKGYFKIARHYGWALNQTFNTYNFSTVLIIEDDLDVSPDIYEYFLGTLPLLQADPTLWCVSAWNDNGKIGLVDKTAHDTIYRTDFFPGLGWMLTKSLWAELSVKWPASYWDDWIRQPQQRKNRACIRPEISRTRTFGKIGVSNGLFYEKYLKFIHLNDQFVPFTKKNLTFLLKDNYDVQFVRSVYNSRVISYQELKSGSIFFEGPVRIPYHTKDEYRRAAKNLGLMDDFRSGVPRTGYRGIVTFFYNKRRVYLAPYANWKGYDLTWS
ncbi:alpha-1,3-mannosyl-glycoprotein 2-beta-N-acetylglucosaminyltransferase-like [Homalodisca vitripennis]|uniref:alpha-1,3-mannosyl-glycoprotein 2-beta-N-acetylglucosaminyltransferase-like n=1 Tax=Homalodisca vitripennis TaxID=197043 RepID=UPI001EEC58AC|nr:alpha-1,3-mannosyl-glycoprotein 2-beta-N-acetylglucosaminyltransferase-like [Homalodisca vitripennis]